MITIGNRLQNRRASDNRYNMNEEIQAAPRYRDEDQHENIELADDSAEDSMNDNIFVAGDETSDDFDTDLRFVPTTKKRFPVRVDFSLVYLGQRQNYATKIF